MRLLANTTLIVLCLIGGSDSHAQNLREEAKQRGYAWRSTNPEDLFLGSPDQLVAKSALIVRGRVVAEGVRLSFDGEYVLTDYTVEILETIKNSGTIPIRNGRVVISRQGGQLLFEGRPIRVDTPYPPIRWIQPHIFFITRSHDSYAELYLASSHMGIFPVKDSKVVCDTEEKRNSPVSREFCGQSEAQFLETLRAKAAKSGQDK